MQNKPTWKKGDIVVLLNHNGCGLHIFEAEYDPQYCSTYFSDKKDWYYGLRNCKEIRPATVEDIDHKIRFQKEQVEREQSRLDELLNFREILMKPKCCDPNAPIEKCVMCGNVVYTCEKQEWGKDGFIPYKIPNDYRCPVHNGGVQSLLGWFCSEECYFKYDDY